MIIESPTVQMFEKWKHILQNLFRVYDPMIQNKVVQSQIMDFDSFIKESEIVVVMVPHSQINPNKISLKTN